MTARARLTLLPAIAAALLAAAWGCNTSGCLDNQSSIPLAGFYSSATGGAVSLDSLDIGGVGAPDDSLLLKAGTVETSVYLPLRFSDNSTAFFIRYCYPALGLDDPRYNDTLRLTYTSEPYFVSEECGAMYRYTITELSYTTHLIDSVALTDSLITNVDLERLRIYFRVADLEPEPGDTPDDNPSEPSAGDEPNNPAEP